MSVGAVLFIIFVVLLLLNVPIAICLGISAMGAIVYGGLSLSMIPINVYSGIGKFLLMAIPFFVLAGNIMEKAGISRRLIDLASAFVGHKRAPRSA
jgi:C4-dicarboxylate transporter DctM subunit